MTTQWYYHEDNQQKGPVSESTLQELLGKNILSANTLIWAEGMDQWKPASEIFGELNSKTVTPPPIPDIPVHGPDESAQELKKMPVILTIIFTILTIGIYYPAWFLTRRNAINHLKSKKKLGRAVFIFAIVIFSISVVLNIISGFLQVLAEGLATSDYLNYTQGIDSVDRLISIIIAITMLVQCFKVRRIFRDHFNIYQKRNITFSGLALFFFQIYYLQYKINRFNKERSGN